MTKTALCVQVRSLHNFCFHKQQKKIFTFSTFITQLNIRLHDIKTPFTDLHLVLFRTTKERLKTWQRKTPPNTSHYIFKDLSHLQTDTGAYVAAVDRRQGWLAAFCKDVTTSLPCLSNSLNPATSLMFVVYTWRPPASVQFKWHPNLERHLTFDTLIQMRWPLARNFMFWELCFFYFESGFA